MAHPYQDVVKLQEKVEKYEKEVLSLLSTQTIPRAPQPLKFEDWYSSFDPERKAMTPDQYRLIERFHLCGIPGVCRTLHERTLKHWEEKQADNGITAPFDPLSATDTHRHIMHDYLAGSEKMKVLMITIPRVYLQALIEGNITALTYEDDTFKHMIDAWGRTTEEIPCVYVHEIVNREYVGGERHEYPGYFLNWFEWGRQLNGLRQYEADTQTYRSSWVAEVDRSFDERGKKPPGHGRYLDNPSQRRALNELIDYIQEVFIDPGQQVCSRDPGDDLLQIPFHRVPREGGWATFGHERVTQHVTLSQSNMLWSLFYSVARVIFGEHRFEVKSYRVLDVCEPAHAQVAECLVSEAAGLYSWYGNCNGAMAGTIPMRTGQGSSTSKAIDQDRFKPLFSKQVAARKTNPHILENLDHELELQKATVQAIAQEKQEPVQVIWSNLAEKQKELQKLLKDFKTRVQEQAKQAPQPPIPRAKLDRLKELHDSLSRKR